MAKMRCEVNDNNLMSILTKHLLEKPSICWNAVVYKSLVENHARSNGQ